MICASLNRLFLIVRLLMTDSHINRGIPRGAGQAFELIRSLLDKIVLVPAGGNPPARAALR
jgi:hypothetical protein